MAGILSANEIISHGEITAEDVDRLRQDIFRDGVRKFPEVELLFRMDDECETKDESWREFFVDALAEFYIFNTDPVGGLSERESRHLIDRILADGRVAGETELALALRIIERANSCPPELGYLVLEAVRESVLHPERAAYGHDRRPNVITAEDVEILSKAIRAPAGDDGASVSRAEAELLFTLEQETDEAENDFAWRDLFVQALAAHLLTPKKGTRDSIDDEEAQWLLGQIRKDGRIRNNERSLLTFLHNKLGFVHPALAPTFAAAGLL